MIIIACNKYRAFTLIELLIVIAIIGILAGIAVPMLLGQREKAKTRVIETSAKGAANELQAISAAYLNSEPVVLLSGPSTETCIEAVAASNTKSCGSYFPNIASVVQYTNLDSIINYYITHKRAMGEKSPYNPTLDLFTLNDPAPGQISLTNSTDRNVIIKGYGELGASLIFNSTVTVR